MENMKLQVIIASTRPGRVGPSVANWFYEVARDQSQFDVELVDLQDMNLPVFDEPNHPAVQQYVHPHTKRWSAKVSEADAFVIVTPEYNFGPPPSLLNALNYLYKEWNYKPVALVSYGGISGGLRSAQMSKLTMTTLKMVPIVEGVIVPMVSKQVNEDGVFQPNNSQIESANTLLTELHRWAVALKPMRG